MKTYFLLALLVAMPAAAKTALPEMTRSQSDLQYSDLATVWDETLAVKEEMLNRNEGLKSMYKADDDNMAVLYVTNATARFFSFGAPGIDHREAYWMTMYKNKHFHKSTTPYVLMTWGEWYDYK